MSKSDEVSLFELNASPSVRREFLGWNAPPVTLFARWLLEHGPQLAGIGRPVHPAAAFAIDLSHLTVVVPTAQSIRPLLLELAIETDRSGQSLYPPTTVPIAGLADHFATPDRPFAGALLRALTWARSLDGIDAASASALGVRAAISHYAPTRLADAQRFDRLINRLGDGRSTPLRSLSADEHEEIISVHESREQYWEAFDRLVIAYRSNLRAVGFDDGRFVTRCAEQATSLIGTLILAGLTHCPYSLRSHIGAASNRTIALIAAPSTHDTLFDDFGIPTSDWATRPPPLKDEDLDFAANPAAQADRAIAWIASLDNVDLSTIVAATDDPEATAAFGAAAEAQGLQQAAARGNPLARSRPYRLLAAIERLCRTSSFSAWSDLIRNPDVQTWLGAHTGSSGSPCDWLAELDRYAKDHLPRQVPSQWFSRYRTLSWLSNATQDLLRDLDPAPVPISSRAKQIASLLEAIYASPSPHEDPGLVAHAEVLRAAIQEMHALPDELHAPSASEALSLLLWMVRDRTASQPVPVDAIEVVTADSLAFSKRPNAILLSMNEGLFGTEASPDPELPDQLLTTLGLPNRIARKAARSFALHNALYSRRRSILIACRQNSVGDPLLPLSELFSCPDTQMLARVRRWARDEDEAPEQPFDPVKFVRELPRLPFTPVQSMSVTDFGAFLKSPYDYYLTRVLKLRDLSVPEPELGPPKFGNLVHDALLRFAQDESVRDETNPECIAAFLDQTLEDIASRWFQEGSPLPFPAQLAHAKARLRIFAVWQADRRKQGWRISAGEWTPENPVEIMVDGTPMPLTGRIDRIDQHPECGYALLDYKTGAAAANPKTTHVNKNGVWLDVQLPLYRRLAAEKIGNSAPQFGYVNLAAEPAEIGLMPADFSSDELRAADLAVDNVIRRVRANDFFDLGPQPPDKGVIGAIIRGLVIGEEEPERTDEAL